MITKAPHIVPRVIGTACISVFFSFFWNSSLLRAQLGDLPPMPQIIVTETHEGFTAKIGNENLRLTVCADSVIHVVAGPADAFSDHTDQPWMLPASESCAGATFKFAQDGNIASITTDRLRVTLSLQRGNLSYSIASGDRLL